ncbi:hypothetical protein P5V15_012193 [Pogonomyrmex californicus]
MLTLIKFRKKFCRSFDTWRFDTFNLVIPQVGDYYWLPYEHTYIRDLSKKRRRAPTSCHTRDVILGAMMALPSERVCAGCEDFMIITTRYASTKYLVNS